MAASPAVACESGIHVWIYPKRGANQPLGGWPDAGRVAADLRALGAAGALPHEVLDGAAKWLTAARLARFADAGLAVVPSVGSRGPSRWRAFADAAVVWLERLLAALKAGAATPLRGAMLDWEAAWDHARREGQLAADYIRARFSDADWALLAAALLDCPWWAPLFLINAHGDRVNTHPGAPTAEFGAVCLRRIVQAYGATAGAGASLRFLRWARHPSQYPALGTPAERVLGAHQAYRRTLNDQVRTLLEPVNLLWQWTELDATCRKALLVVKALRELGFVGADAVTRFQAAEGLVADGIVGPRTLGALGSHGKATDAAPPSRLVSLFTPRPTHPAELDATRALAVAA